MKNYIPSLKRGFFLVILLLSSTTVFSNTFENNDKIDLSPVSIVVAPITSFTPSTGAAGTVVTISDTGGNFLLGQPVTLNGGLIPAINVNFIDENTLNVTIPCGASTGKFSVDGGVDSTNTFTYIVLSPPTAAAQAF